MEEEPVPVSIQTENRTENNGPHIRGYTKKELEKVSRNRILSEYKSVIEDGSESIIVTINEKNIYRWTCYVSGPEKSMYENLIYEILVEFPVEYPFKPSALYFVRKIYHPTILSTGRVILPGLDKFWSPAMKIVHILLSFHSFMLDPDTDGDIYNEEALELYRNDKEKYREKVLEWYDFYNEEAMKLYRHNQ